MNLEGQSDRLPHGQALSALMDGDGSQADDACRAWRDDARARADWHAYHLIGELMRSDDTHCVAQRDAQFLARLRQRMAGEPVVLAPVAALDRIPWRHAWVAPAVVAAGFVAVAGVMLVTRVAAPVGAAPDRSSLLAGSMAAPPAPSAPSASSAPGALVADGTLIRNAELDRYLAAHKQYSSSSALAMPGGMVRNAAALAPGR
jgi:sigma-E factor negative regulatory protein RseA